MFLFLGKFPDPGGLKLLSDPASLLLIVDVSVLDSNVLTIDVLPKTTQISILIIICLIVISLTNSHFTKAVSHHLSNMSCNFYVQNSFVKF